MTISQLSLLDVHRTAVFSPCKTWRYHLGRHWDMDKGVIAFILMNPSTADEYQDDPTIRRCIGFAKRWGYGGLSILNIFALRSTDPKALATHPDPMGPENERYLADTVRSHAEVIVAWGADANPGLRRSGIEVIVQQFGYPVSCARLLCLGKTQSGDPRHPLYLRADAERVLWP